MTKSSRPHRARHKVSTPKWKTRLLDAGIILATGLICLFVFSFSTRLSYSRPEVREAPIIVRVQILNGSGRPGLGRRVADRMAPLQVGRMRFDLIDVGNFDRTDIRKSFVINRHLDPQQMRAILAALNLGEIQTADGVGAGNDLGVDMTLVLGSNTVEPPGSDPKTATGSGNR